MTKRKNAVGDLLGEEKKPAEKRQKKQRSPEEEIVFSFRVSEGFKRQFQAWCALKGMTQSEALEDAYRLLVREYGD